MDLKKLHEPVDHIQKIVFAIRDKGTISIEKIQNLFGQTDRCSE